MPGSANNADNAESQAGDVVLACALAPVFALLFVVLRFYTAQRILKTIHVDDCKCCHGGMQALLTHTGLILLALVFSLLSDPPRTPLTLDARFCPSAIPSALFSVRPTTTPRWPN